MHSTRKGPVVIVLAVTLTLAAVACAQAQQTPPQPAPAPAPPQPMSFFVTSVGLGDGANLGGLAGADKHFQAMAHLRRTQESSLAASILRVG